MIINGANTNTFSMAFANLHKNAGTAMTSEKIFSRRFDTLELSSFFKKFSNETENKSCVAEIRKMLSETESGDSAERMAKGITGYAYMEISLAREAMRTETNIFKFNYYSEERSYYQGLLNEADGNEAASISRQMPLYDDYEYICRENEPVDREKALQALANVQSRIDDLINDTKNENDKVDMQTYNKCAASFASAFGTENSSVALSEKDYNKLFGKLEATEEDYVQKCSERAKSLWKCYDNLKECLNKCIDRVRSGLNGEERVKVINTAFARAYGSSLEDITKLIEELQVTDETEQQ